MVNLVNRGANDGRKDIAKYPDFKKILDDAIDGLAMAMAL